MIVCPKSNPCGHKTNKIRINPSNVCYWWFLGWCNTEKQYEGKKPEGVK